MTLLPGQYRVFVNRNVNNVTVTPVRNVAENRSFSARLFPNPVQAGLTIDLHIRESGRITFSIWNLQGQKIRDLKESFLVTGDHKIVVEKKDLHLSAGTYYLRIHSKEATQTVPFIIQ